MNWTLIIVGVAFLVAGGAMVVPELVIARDQLYGGKEVFQTEKAYEDFKTVMGSQEVDMREIEVLSSSPPIVVEYVIKATPDYDFPYGKKKRDPNHWSLLILGGVFATTGAGFGTAGIFIKGD